MNQYDKVRKVGGDYQFEGVIVAKFSKLSGKERYVVEDDRGILHIFSEPNLCLVELVTAQSDMPLMTCLTCGWKQTFPRKQILDGYTAGHCTNCGLAVAIWKL